MRTHEYGITTAWSSTAILNNQNGGTDGTDIVTYHYDYSFIYGKETKIYYSPGTPLFEILFNTE